MSDGIEEYRFNRDNAWMSFEVMDEAKGRAFANEVFGIKLISVEVDGDTIKAVLLPDSLICLHTLLKQAAEKSVLSKYIDFSTVKCNFPKYRIVEDLVHLTAETLYLRTVINSTRALVTESTKEVVNLRRAVSELNIGLKRSNELSVDMFRTNETILKIIPEISQQLVLAGQSGLAGLQFLVTHH